MNTAPNTINSDLTALSFDDLYLISDSLHTALRQTTLRSKQRQIADLLQRVDQVLSSMD